MLSIKKPSEVPWTNVFHIANWYTVYFEDDRYIFVPREKHIGGLLSAFDGACKMGTMIEQMEVKGFHIIHRGGGDVAGQEIDWPYIELIKIKG